MASDVPYASPSVRKYARELGVDLGRVKGSGPGGRLLREDVQAFVKSGGAARAPDPTPAAGGAALDLPAWPDLDHAKFGPIEEIEPTRIQRLSARNMARNWAMVPHVANFDKADVTDLEAFRQQINAENARRGVKATALAFMVKASVSALKEHPRFNVSFANGRIIQKKYFHIGFAADTPNGLVVPVIRDADRKGLIELAREMAELAALARDGKLSPAQMSGGCFTISSLGGIGGTGFTPIINAPEVAILGAGRSEMQPVWDGERFAPRLMQPLSLSWDHRAVDGAAAARFLGHICRALSDLKQLTR